MPVLQASSGVAPVMASKSSAAGSRPVKMVCRVSARPGRAGETPPGSSHWLSSAGKAMMTAAKPTMAGLNRLWPSPPYRCLAMTMANSMPVAATHHGASGGMHSANSTAAMRALPSVMKGLRGRWRSLSMAASKPSAKTAASRICAITPQPKNHAWATATGVRAYSTCRMTAPTLVAGGWWGAPVNSVIVAGWLVGGWSGRLGFLPGARYGGLDFVFGAAIFAQSFLAPAAALQALAPFFFQPLFARLKTPPGQLGLTRIKLAAHQFILAVAVVVHQRNMAGADAGAQSAFYAVGQMVVGAVFVASGLDEFEQGLRQQAVWTDAHAFAAVDAGHGRPCRARFGPGESPQAAAALVIGDAVAGQRRAHHGPAQHQPGAGLVVSIGGLD